MTDVFVVMQGGAFSAWEQIALWSVLGVAILGLLYAGFLTAEVMRQDTGTDAMRRISQAIRVGANAYLNRQFRAIALLVLVLAGLLYFTAGDAHIALGRACAFLMGSIFSASVGFIGMNMAVQGNVRVAAASRRSSRRRSRSPIAPAPSPACSPTAWGCWAVPSSS